MKRLTARLLTALLLITLTACTAQRYLEAGDAALDTGDMRGAVYHYQRAMDADDGLTRNKKFMAKLAMAEARVAYDEAVRLRGSGDYEKAIAKLKLAIERDPAYDEPKRLMPHVRVEAARVRYVRAVQSADAGDLREAREHLNQALSHDLSNEEASFAMASLSPERLPDETPGLATLREGQSLAAERRWIEAEQVLSRAVAEGPGLLTARASLHNARMQLTRSRRLTEQGTARLTERAIGPSIQALTEALEIWPFNESASDVLKQANAKRELADQKLAEASDAAGRQDWEQAIALADSGLAIDQSHTGLHTVRKQFHQHGAADYAEKGDALYAERRLIEAQKAYARAAELDPSLRDAQTGLRKTGSDLDQARGLMVDAAAHYEARVMAGTIDLLNRSLEIWPFNEDAKSLLVEAKKDQQRAGEVFADASVAAEKQDWDGAIALADQALSLDQSHPGLSEFRADLPVRAAAAWNEQGAGHLANAKLDDAHDAYAQALRFIGNDMTALSGLAAVAQAKGAALEAKGLVGAALLHYTVGRGYQDSHPVAEAWQRAMAAIHGRVGMGLGVSVGGGRGGAVGPDEVAQAVLGTLAGYHRDGLAVGQAQPPYILELTIGEARIDKRRIGSTAYSYEFTTHEMRHNDEYDRIAAHLHREQRVLRDIQSDYNHHASRHRSAQQAASRMKPGAAPQKPSPPPPSKSSPPQDGETERQRNRREREEATRARLQAKYEREMAEYRRAMSEYQRKEQAYQRELSNAKHIERECDRINSKLRRQSGIVSSLSRELSRTPHQIRVSIRNTWPYTVETYEKQGRLAVTAELIDTATGRAVDRVDHHADFAARDDLLLNANPGIGLNENPLRLPSDGAVRGELTEELAAASGPWAVEAAVQHRLGLLYKEIEALRKAGKTEEALESEVDAAVLLGLVDGQASAKQIDDLAEKHAQ